jgi:hypothetical protein
MSGYRLGFGWLSLTLLCLASFSLLFKLLVIMANKDTLLAWPDQDAGIETRTIESLALTARHS